MTSRASSDYMGFQVHISHQPQVRAREVAAPIDLERMQRALAGPSRMIPNGLSPEEVLEFILGPDTSTGK